MDRTREVADDVRRQASSLLDEGRREGKQALAQQKDAAAGEVGAAASALRSAADDLHRQRDDRAGRFVSYAAERLESFGQVVRTKDIDSLIEDAERLGRRSPAAFFAGSVALGFLLSRFLKSSRTASQHDGRFEGEDRPPSAGSMPSAPLAAGAGPAGYTPARSAVTSPFPPGATDRSRPDDADDRAAPAATGSNTEVTR